MNNPIIFIGSESREMTDAEYAQWQNDNEATAAKTQALAAARSAAFSKLKALGLTETEIAALIEV